MVKLNRLKREGEFFSSRLQLIWATIDVSSLKKKKKENQFWNDSEFSLSRDWSSISRSSAFTDSSSLLFLLHHLSVIFHFMNVNSNHFHIKILDMESLKESRCIDDRYARELHCLNWYPRLKKVIIDVIGWMEDLPLLLSLSSLNDSFKMNHSNLLNDMMTLKYVVDTLTRRTEKPWETQLMDKLKESS